MIQYYANVYMSILETIINAYRWNLRQFVNLVLAKQNTSILPDKFAANSLLHELWSPLCGQQCRSPISSIKLWICFIMTYAADTKSCHTLAEYHAARWSRWYDIFHGLNISLSLPKQLTRAIKHVEWNVSHRFVKVSKSIIIGCTIW